MGISFLHNFFGFLHPSNVLMYGIYAYVFEPQVDQISSGLSMWFIYTLEANSWGIVLDIVRTIHTIVHSHWSMVNTIQVW